MVIPVSSFTEVEEFRGDSHGDDISNDAGMSKSSVSSLVLSVIGRESSIELPPQNMHCQRTSFPDWTAALYWSLVMPV